MDKAFKIKDLIPYLRPELEDKISKNAQILKVKKGDQLLSEGQYVKSIPIVINGLIKVKTSSLEKELLIYYIKPGESCIMSFSAVLNDEKSQIFATAEDDTTLLLLPSSKVISWVKKYPEFNSIFYKLYHKRYQDLIDTINHLINDNLDLRVYKYLKEKVSLTMINPIRISHRSIAKELGTSREVVTRILHKLENNGKVIQIDNTIKVI